MLLTSAQIAKFRKYVVSGILNVITLDTETSISKFFSFFAGKQYLDPRSIEQATETKVMTAQYMRSLTGKPQYFAWEFDKSTLKGSDYNVIEQIVSVVNTADIIITQNGDKFDIPIIQERAKLLRLPPIESPLSLDTLKLNRRSCRTISHSLDARSKQYGLGGKHRMCREDWIDIVEGRVSVEDKMVPYGLKDVKDTDRVFWLDLPYYNFPKATISKILRMINWGEGEDCCPHCEKMKQKKYDIFIKGKFGYCNNCELKWEVEKK